MVTRNESLAFLAWASLILCSGILDAYSAFAILSKVHYGVQLFPVAYLVDSSWSHVVSCWIAHGLCHLLQRPFFQSFEANFICYVCYLCKCTNLICKTNSNDLSTMYIYHNRWWVSNRQIVWVCFGCSVFLFNTSSFDLIMNKLDLVVIDTGKGVFMH